MVAIPIIQGATVGLWTLVDARKRREPFDWLGLAIVTAVLWPIALPLYVANRNLKEGEVRIGGRGWQIAKNYFVLVTVIFLTLGLRACAYILERDEPHAWPWMVATLSFSYVWFIVMLIFFRARRRKNPDEVERGPTGALAEEEESAP